MTSGPMRSSEPKGSQVGKPRPRQALAALPADYKPAPTQKQSQVGEPPAPQAIAALPAGYKPMPRSPQAIAALPAGYKPPTADESRDLDVRARAVLDAIDNQEWHNVFDLCKDFHASEIVALVTLLRADFRLRMERARKRRSTIAANNAAKRWENLELLRTFACRKHDARKWQSAQQAAMRILPSVLKERDRLGLSTPNKSNAEKWLVHLLRKHRRKLPNAKH